MLRILQCVSLIGATLSMGLMAGVFVLYSHTIMPGLARTNDRTFVGAFQSIDRAIINPWFLPTFLGALLFTALAAALHAREGRAALPWIVAALVLYLAVFTITLRIHVPLNDAIKEAGDPDRIADLAAVRVRFDEARWMRWNLARAFATTAAFACLSWALVEFGRTVLAPGAITR